MMKEYFTFLFPKMAQSGIVEIWHVASQPDTDWTFFWRIVFLDANSAVIFAPLWDSPVFAFFFLPHLIFRF